MNVWILFSIVKIVLLGALTYFVQKVRKSIDAADATNIKKNFKIVEVLTYVIVAVNYGLFAMKLLKDGIDKKEEYNHQKYCGMKYVNLSLVLVLLAFILQTKSALNVAEKGPVPLSFLTDNFRLTENLTYILLGFNALTSGIVLFTHRDELPILSPSSLKSLRSRLF